MRRAPSVGVGAAACSDSDGSTATGPITFDVTHYDYTLDLTSHAAHAAVTMSVTVAGNCVTIPFRATALANVTLGGEAATSITEASTSSLTACGQGFDMGDTFELDADMTITLETLQTSQVGFSITNDSDGNPFTYLVSWVNGCDQFAPCDNRPDVFATYHFDVTHDPSLMVRCPGDITEKSTTETICDFNHPGGPTYSTFGIAAYPAWTQTDEGMWGGVHVTVYDRASTGITTAIDSTWHSGFLTWMQSEFGPYPFGTDLRVLTAPTYWSGFEHPGNIVLDDTLAKPVMGTYYKNPVQHVLDHEMTHMWAGDQTTIAGTYDFVWKESMAEYLAYVWEDMNDPSVSLVTAYVWKTDSAPAKYFPVPQDKPDLFTYYTDVYGPGPMVLFHQLEVMTSRAQVLAAIQMVLGQPHALSVDDLLAALTTTTGLDLTDYTAAWIKGSGTPSWPQLQLTYTDAPTTSSLQIHQTNASATSHGCMFHITLHGANPTDTQSVAVDTFANGVEQTLQVPTPAFPVTSLELDPAQECLVFLYSSSPRIAPDVHPWLSNRAVTNR